MRFLELFGETPHGHLICLARSPFININLKLAVRRVFLAFSGKEETFRKLLIWQNMTNLRNVIP